MKRVIASLTAGFALLLASLGSAADSPANVLTGRAGVYKQLSPESLESVSTPAAIKSVSTNRAPTEIWRILEHGEKVECLSCIPAVSELLYDSHAKTREISAWWLRRRIFGVFGPGQVYSQVVTALQTSPDEQQRAYAAEALGEFLSASGVKYVAQAAVGDASSLVRRSAVAALERLQSQGPNGELAVALSDSDEEVRLAALHAAIRVHVFSALDSVVALISDPSARVRKRTAESLGVMRARDAVVGLVALTSPDTEPNPEVRIAAVAALGQIGDSAVRPDIERALDDPHVFVRDAAHVALQLL